MYRRHDKSASTFSGETSGSLPVRAGQWSTLLLLVVEGERVIRGGTGQRRPGIGVGVVANEDSDGS